MLDQSQCLVGSVETSTYHNKRFNCAQGSENGPGPQALILSGRTHAVTLIKVFPSVVRISTVTCMEYLLSRP